MCVWPMVPLFVLLALTARGHRDSESSVDRATGQLSVGAESEAHAAASAAASAEAKTEFEREVHKRKSKPDNIIEECRKAQEARESGMLKKTETEENVKTLATCIDRLTELAHATAKQRKASMDANQEYAEDIIEARTIMDYLGKKMASRDREFQKYRMDEKRREQELTDLMHRISSNRQTSGFSSMLQAEQAGSDYPMLQAQQAALLQAQQAVIPQVVPAPMQNFAAMFTPTGQSFGVPPVRTGLAGQPSLLQLGVPPNVNRGVGTGASDLQAKLDREAARMEESDGAEDMF